MIATGYHSLDLRLDDEETAQGVPHMAELDPMLGDRVVYLRNGSDFLVIEVQK